MFKMFHKIADTLSKSDVKQPKIGIKTGVNIRCYKKPDADSKAEDYLETRGRRYTRVVGKL